MLFLAELISRILLCSFMRYNRTPHDAAVSLCQTPQTWQSSPLRQATLGQTGDDDGVKRLLSTRDGDAQGTAIALKLHGVDDGARVLLLICNTSA